jgi:hypothetical protein
VHLDSGPSTAAPLAVADVHLAAHAVDAAVRTLCRDPESRTVIDAVDAARTAVDHLPSGLVATTLHRLLDTITDCHRAGRPTSSRLVARRGAAARAVRLAH